MNIDPGLHRIVAAQPYPLLFATISGAHLYGFPSRDSDFDLRGAHVLPLEKVVSLDVCDETVEDSRVIEELEMDIVSHDVKKFFGLLLKKNGYVLEQLFSPLIVHTTPEHEELKAICCPKRFDTSPTPLPGRGGEGVITKHHSHHYFGFTETQWTNTTTFSGVPVNISLAPDQGGAGACPILDLQLGPITLNLLGLVAETSPICLEITAFEGGGLLGDLLCGIANLLNQGLTLNQILAGLPSGDLSSLLTGLTNLFNGALSNLSHAILTAIADVHSHGTCAILHLELGPLDLTLLGLEVVLDNCANGAVTVDITAQTGRGKLLGNLLCELLGGDLINIGSTLQEILNQILVLLSI